ncbi:hypothetical protein LX32DRAFT_66478 [Colletotrichum zoysiae]|uniref:Uncharacterized protein n=1 Tax=Colletotrichum zoysiae TaxID=1216348 RepID=A0AAD9HA62_9PEZI|nr:hypothetical protein LX32DRAFT_66478 [Colletotrichum zoysiae]
MQRIRPTHSRRRLSHSEVGGRPMQRPLPSLYQASGPRTLHTRFPANPPPRATPHSPQPSDHGPASRRQEPVGPDRPRRRRKHTYTRPRCSRTAKIENTGEGALSQGKDEERKRGRRKERKRGGMKKKWETCPPPRTHQVLFRNVTLQS